MIGSNVTLGQSDSLFLPECGMESEDSLSQMHDSTHVTVGMAASSSEGALCESSLLDPIYMDLLRFMPEGEPIKVRVNFIILQKSDGTGNFQDNQEHRDFLNDWVDYCNEVFANTWWGSDDGCYPAASDALVEVIPNFVFLPDPSTDDFYWNNLNGNTIYNCPSRSSWWLNPLDDILNNDPTIPRGVNVYMTMDADIYHQFITIGSISDPEDASGVWCSEQPVVGDFDAPSRIHIPNLYLSYYWFKNNLIGSNNEPFSVTREWLVNSGATVAHELGHSFIGEYIHFGDRSSENCSDHLMTRQGDIGLRRSLRDKDVQFIHRSFVHSNLRQFIPCYSRYNESMYSADREWNITEDEEWVNDMRIYHNLRVSSEATLTIRCKLLMPEDGVIIVERGGRLIVDGGEVLRANTCSSSDHWAGIAVKGNPDQAHPTDPNGILDPNGAGVVILQEGGLIEGAERAVITQSHPHWDVPSDRGGVIQADNFTFLDNIRSVGFMRYDYPNISRFKDVLFLNENGNGISGANIWRTDGISFEGCTFDGLEVTGISSWDASYDVTKNNTFKNCDVAGIEAGGSMPLLGHLTVGRETQLSSDRNQFSNNTIGILARSNAKTIFENNDMENLDIDFAASGFSQNNISNNNFEGVAVGVQLDGTEGAMNDLECNVYEGNIVGVNIVGKNENSNIWSEDFSTSNHDIFIEGLSSNPGMIQENQGSFQNGRVNEFSSGLSEQIKTSTVAPWDHTESFNYFHPDASSNPRLKPLCAQNDFCTPQSDFLNYQANFSTADNCQNIDGPRGEVICETRVCLDSLRSFISNLEASIGISSSDSLTAVLKEAVYERERIVLNWLQDYIDQEDWTSATELLTSDYNGFNRRRHVAISLMRDEYSLADSLLLAFPQQLPGDQQFVQIQKINHSFLSDTGFTLSSSQQDLLNTIGSSGTVEAGYAQTLLSLLTDSIIMPRLPILEESPAILLSESAEFASNDELLISPNPASTQLTVLLNNKVESTSNTVYTIKVYRGGDGGEIRSFPINNNQQKIITTTNWPSGLYLFQLTDPVQGRIGEAQKVLITH